MGLLNTIETLVSVMDEHEDVMTQLEPVALQVRPQFNINQSSGIITREGRKVYHSSMQVTTCYRRNNELVKCSRLLCTFEVHKIEASDEFVVCKIVLGSKFDSYDL